MQRQRLLRGTALVIALVQFVLGGAYLFAPVAFQASLGLTDLPAWTGWPFGMMGARFIAFGYGMVLVFRNPLANRGWIQAMILVQAVDWIVTMANVAGGTLALRQVAGASFLPVLFTIGLVVAYPREDTAIARPLAPS
jgi:hypothetical protein